MAHTRHPLKPNVFRGGAACARTRSPPPGFLTLPPRAVAPSLSGRRARTYRLPNSAVPRRLHHRRPLVSHGGRRAGARKIPIRLRSRKKKCTRLVPPRQCGPGDPSAVVRGVRSDCTLTAAVEVSNSERRGDHDDDVQNNNNAEQQRHNAHRVYTKRHHRAVVCGSRSSSSSSMPAVLRYNNIITSVRPSFSATELPRCAHANTKAARRRAAATRSALTGTAQTYPRAHTDTRTHAHTHTYTHASARARSNTHMLDVLAHTRADTSYTLVHVHDISVALSPLSQVGGKHYALFCFRSFSLFLFLCFTFPLIACDTTAATTAGIFTFFFLPIFFFQF